MKELEKDFIDSVKMLADSVKKNIEYEKRIGKAKHIYYKSLQEHNEKNQKLPKEMVKMFNYMEGNIK